jgi:CHAD domain-containing protein
MRIALTRLRTAIVFFSPMVADRQLPQIRRELKWLNTHLGVVRDLDVAVERLPAARRRHVHMGREWVVVHHPAQTGRANPRPPDRRL